MCIGYSDSWFREKCRIAIWREGGVGIDTELERRSGRNKHKAKYSLLNLAAITSQVKQTIHGPTALHPLQQKNREQLSRRLFSADKHTKSQRFFVARAVVLVRSRVKNALHAEERHAVNVAPAEHGLGELGSAAVEHAHVRRYEGPVPDA